MKIKKILPVLGVVIAILLALWYLKTDFVHPWFAISWGIITAIGSFFKEIKSWWRGERTIKLFPQIQLILLLFMIIVTVITTNWTALEGKDIRQWMLIIFPIFYLYWDGIVWAWKNLIKKAA